MKTLHLIAQHGILHGSGKVEEPAQDFYDFFMRRMIS
jgi:hypothetical protein